MKINWTYFLNLEGDQNQEEFYI